MNKDLVRELKVANYNFPWFLKGARTRSTMGEALVAATKIFLGIQMEDPKVPAGAIIEALTENGSGELWPHNRKFLVRR